MTRDVPIPRFGENGEFLGYAGTRRVEVLEPRADTPLASSSVVGRFVRDLERRPRAPRRADPELPVCPCCGRLDADGNPTRGLAFTTEWRDLYDLEHDCDCAVTHAAEYDAGLLALWQTRGRRKAFLQSVPERFRSCRLTNYRQRPENLEAYRVARALRLGQNLFLHGDPGNGKTHLSVAAALNLVSSGSARYQSCVTLREDVMTAIRSNTAKPDWTTPDVLILDDLDKAIPSEFVFELVFAALDARWSRGRTTIVTANHAPGFVADRLAVMRQGEAIVRDRQSADALLSRLTSGRVVQVLASDERVGRD